MLFCTSRRGGQNARPLALCGALLGGACTATGPPEEERASDARREGAGELASGGDEGGEFEAETGNLLAQRHDGSKAPPSREHRRANRAMMLYTAPSFAAPFRGKIAHAEAFSIEARVSGDDTKCGDEGWARLGTAAFACLEHTSRSDVEPRRLPELPSERLVPFYYARLKPKRKDGTNPPAPIWRSRRSVREGRPPIGQLEPAHVYAFDERRRTRQGVLLGSRLGVIRESDVKKLEPGDFEGRDLIAEPIPPGMTLAWTVTWPDVPVLADPAPNARILRRLAYHEPLLLLGAPVQRRGTTFHRVASPHAGWVDGSEIRRFIPMKPPPDVGDDELWLDVELDQQTLTMLRGERAQFVTLISSGSWKDPTPTGLFRIGTKEAYGDMRSRVGDDDAYHVEAVPWVQYFHASYALHGAYWHNRFGRRTSHGCINLSPKDAARVFDLTTPLLPPGWSMIYEHADDPGTLLRVRKLLEDPADRRQAPRERRASDYH